MPCANVNGGTLAYEVSGGGHPVAFLHGHTLDRRLWDPIAAYLSLSYTVICVDLRGHGRSAVPETGYAMADYAADLLGLVDLLGYRRVSLVGHSLGGIIAIELALTHPDRFTTMTLVGTGLGGFQHPEESRAMTERKKSLVRTEGVSEKFVRTAIYGTLYEATPDYAGKQAKLREMISGWSGAQWKDAATYPPPAKPQRDRLSEIKAPTLVAVGEHDRADFHAIANELAKGIAVVRKAIVPEAGHLAPLENPEAFGHILLDFLNGAVGKALV